MPSEGPQRRFDPVTILEVLAHHRVSFIVIGGVAASLQGSPSITWDLDICYARDDENLRRLAAALRQLDARLRGVPDEVPFLLDELTLEKGDSFTFSTEAGSFDCLGTPTGTNGFDDLIANASAFDMDGVQVLVASVEDLIRMKRAAGRPQDLKEVEILGAIREMTSEH